MKVILKQKKNGFTLVEMLVAMGIFSVLFGFIWLNLLASKESASQSSSLDVFISDLRSMQLKAMIGDTEGRVTADPYGVFLGTTSYTLFHGSAFNPSDLTNREVTLGDNESFVSVLFPGNVILFAKGSGEVVNFDPLAHSVSVQNLQTKSTKTVQLNMYGVTTATN